MTGPAWVQGAIDVLACPVCTGPLTGAATGLVCAAGHSFDRARQGHVTLLPPGHQPPSGDSAAMVADRVAFLHQGRFQFVGTFDEAARGGHPVLQEYFRAMGGYLT